MAEAVTNATRRIAAATAALLLIATIGVAHASTPDRAPVQLLRVLDGDTLVVLDRSGRRLTVRVVGIDAPEKSQPFADRARQRLRDQTRGCDLTIEQLKQDRFSRAVARVMCDDRDLGLDQIEAGMAWHFRRYAKEQPIEERQRYSNAEQSARLARRGLWREPAPVAPWDYRDQVRGRRAAPAAAAAAATPR